MKIIMVSDLHGDIQSGGYPRFDDCKKALHEVVDYAIERKADYFICGGDVITNDPDLYRFIKIITLCQEISLKLKRNTITDIWVVGNHDYHKGDDIVTALDPLMTTGNVAKEPCYHENMVFLPFTHKDYDLDKECRDIAEIVGGEKIKLVVGHLNIEGIEHGSETTEFPRGRNVFFPLETVKEVFPNAILCNGHYHKRQTYKGIHIIGSLLNLTRGEVHNTPGFLEIDI